MLNKRIILLLICIFIVIICYYSFIDRVSVDEIWNYGFSYNISKGLVVYKDFNIVTTPLYFFIGSFFIKLFGPYMFSLHILDSLFISIICYILFKKIKYKFFAVFPLFFMLVIPSYNLFCFCLLYVIIYLINNNIKNDWVFGLIVGLIFITKQNIGIFMLLPCMYYSKDKIKSFIMFCIPFFVLAIYLLFNNAFIQFLDYCFFGLLDFNQSNQYYDKFIFVSVIGFCVYFLYILFKSRFKDRELFFILMFQIINYPIFDYNHFLYSLFLFFYVLLTRYNNIILFICICFFCYYSFYYKLINYFPLKSNFDNNFLRYKNVDVGSYYKFNIKKYILSSYYQFYVFGCTYFYKLLYNINISKYDLINNGNMGYHGEDRIILEFDEFCGKKKCVYFVGDDVENFEQLNKKILNYVKDNYKYVEKLDNIYVYTNY